MQFEKSDSYDILKLCKAMINRKRAKLTQTRR